MSKTPYALIRDEALRLDLPRTMTSDLRVHDRKLLSGEDAPEWFGWILEEHGTHLIRGDSTPETVAAYHSCAVDGTFRQAHLYVYDGVGLTKCASADDWRDWMTERMDREREAREAHQSAIHRLIYADPTRIVGFADQDALGISRRDRETVEEALLRAGV